MGNGVCPVGKKVMKLNLSVIVSKHCHLHMNEL